MRYIIVFEFITVIQMVITIFLNFFSKNKIANNTKTHIVITISMVCNSIIMVNHLFLVVIYIHI